MKSALKGTALFYATDVIKNDKVELKRLSKNVFQKRFQHLYSRWQKCILAQWDYVRGNVPYLNVLFCMCRNNVILGTC